MVRRRTGMEWREESEDSLSLHDWRLLQLRSNCCRRLYESLALSLSLSHSLTHTVAYPEQHTQSPSSERVLTAVPHSLLPRSPSLALSLSG